MVFVYGIEVLRCEGCQVFMSLEELFVMEISMVGFDLVKNVFQVYGVDLEGNVVVCRML